jgi:hypothetical protein
MISSTTGWKFLVLSITSLMSFASTNISLATRLLIATW